MLASATAPEIPPQSRTWVMIYPPMMLHGQVPKWHNNLCTKESCEQSGWQLKFHLQAYSWISGAARPVKEAHRHSSIHVIFSNPGARLWSIPQVALPVHCSSNGSTCFDVSRLYLPIIIPFQFLPLCAKDSPPPQHLQTLWTSVSPQPCCCQLS